MKAYIVTYHGLWMGGVAVVLAENEEAARQMVSEDAQTVAFENVEVEEVGSIRKPRVVYNWNGNY